MIRSNPVLPSTWWVKALRALAEDRQIGVVGKKAIAWPPVLSRAIPSAQSFRALPWWKSSGQQAGAEGWPMLVRARRQRAAINLGERAGAGIAFRSNASSSRINASALGRCHSGCRRALDAPRRK